MRRHGKGTELRDQVIRSQARALINEKIANASEMSALGVDPCLIRFEPIDYAALLVSDTWQKSVYPWSSVSQWKVKDAKGFDLALWYDQILCGMCYATPRKSRLRIKIILLEGKPEGIHPLKGMVAPLALRAVDLYALMLGCKAIEIQQPEPHVVDYYLTLGFRFDESGRLVISVGGF